MIDPDEPASASQVVSAGTPPEVRADGFGWTYRSRTEPALRGLTFALPPGCVLLVLGPSGCGKSTLARALVGLVPHVLPGTWTGRLSIAELDVASTPAPQLGDRVGLVFQDPESQLVMARVEDEVAFGLENRGWPTLEMRRRVPSVLGQVGLHGFERRGTATLSGGEKQRLAIADVLAPAPGLLVFDEPTANLDPPGMFETFEQLGDLSRQRDHTIVIVEHRLEAVLPLADLVLVLGEDGRQVGFGAPDEVGRTHARTLERMGGWVPSHWRGWAGRPAVEAAPAAHAEIPANVGPPGAILAADDVSVRYALDASGPHPPALDRVSFVLRRGERVALVGPNGSGKSTLLFALAGLRRVDSGGVRLLAADGTATDPRRLPAAGLAARIGLVFQDPEVGFIGRTVAEDVAVAGDAGRHGSGADAHGGPADVQAGIVALLERFGLSGLADRDPFRLSQGQQRRLSIAAVSLRPPDVLLLDEPTFGLDRRGSDAVLTLLDELRASGQAQILATHDPRLLLACDRTVALDRGRVVFDAPSRAFLEHPPFSPAAPWQLPVPAVTAA